MSLAAKLKLNPNGSIDHYKARLDGFNQEEGVDYHDKFSPVVKPFHYCIIKRLVSLTIR